MINTINEILKGYKTIRKKNDRMTFWEGCFVIGFFATFVITTIFAIVDPELNSRLEKWFVIGGIFANMICLFAMIKILRNEKVPGYDDDALYEIHNFFRKEGINNKEQRGMLREVIRDSISSGTNSIIGVSTICSLLISPVFAYGINEFVKAILKIENGVLQIVSGAAMAMYIEVVIFVFFMIGIINITIFLLRRKEWMKKELIQVINQIDLWQSIHDEKKVAK